MLFIQLARCSEFISSNTFDVPIILSYLSEIAMTRPLALLILPYRSLWIFSFSFFSPFLISVSDSQGFCNKVPQTVWLKTTEIYSLMVLEARSLKLRWQQGHAPYENLGSILPCFSIASGGSHQFLAFLDLHMHCSKLCLCHHIVFFMCVSVSPYKNTSHIGLRA